jgi:hypothetical protein
MNGSPANLNNLTINNSNGVTLGQNTTIAGSLTLTSGNLNIGSNTLTLNGSVSRTSGYLSGTTGSNLTLGGSTSQTIFFNPSGNTIKDLTLTNSGGVSLGNALIIAAGSTPGSVTVSSGSTLNSAGFLTLKSDANGSAYIANSAGTINGTVNIERYIPASRKHRILSHPFSTSLNLSQLTDDIDITGNSTGAISNSAKTLGTGFTSSPTNNPSAFWFSTADADGASYDGGWKAFTAADGSGSNNSWSSGQAIRLLIRGSKGQGLNGNTYTPSNVTLTMSGTLNYGNVNVSMAFGGSGNSAGYNLIGNPYASPVDISSVVYASANEPAINKTIYTRNPQTGAWVSQLLQNGTPYYLPAYTGAFIQNSSSNSVNLPFTEARKGTSSSLNTFKTNTFPNGIQLKCFIGGTEFDNLYILFDDKASSSYDIKEDAFKLVNDSFNFNAITPDNISVCTDVRPLESSKVIPLYTQLKSGQNSIQIRVENIGQNNGFELYLVDRFTSKRVLLTRDVVYHFEIDASQPETFGSNRFYLEVKQLQNGIKEANNTNHFIVFPNPATDVLQIQAISQVQEQVQIAIIDPLGHEVMQGYWFNPSKGDYRMDIKDLGNGVYTILIKGEHVRHSQLFIKAE